MNTLQVDQALLLLIVGMARAQHGCLESSLR